MQDEVNSSQKCWKSLSFFLFSEFLDEKKRSKADQSFNIAEIITQNVGYSDILLAVDVKEYSFG